MLTYKPGRFSAMRNFFLTLLILLGVGGTRLAHGADEGPTATEVLSEAMQLLQRQDYDGAIDAMYTYLDLVVDSKMPRVLKIAQDTRYKLATILISKDRTGEAIPVLQDYVSKPQALHVRKARKMLAACLFDEEMYQETIVAVTNALHYNMNPMVFEEAGGRRDAFRRDDEDTFADVGGEEEPDLPYSQEELVMLYLTMADSYYKLGEATRDHDQSIEYYQECIEPFTYVTDKTEDERRKGYAIMQMINALIQLDGFDRIIEWVPQLYKTSARFDIRVNLALLNAAAALFEAGEYDAALPLYRMILPREELIEYQTKKLYDMKREAGLPDRFGEEWTEDESFLFGEADATRQLEEESLHTLGAGIRVEEIDEQQEAEQTMPSDIMELQMLLDTLKGMPPYENFVVFQMAQLYKNVERYWEAVKFFKMVHEKDAASEIGQRSVYEAVALLIDKLNQQKDGEALAFEYLDSTNVGMFPRLVAYVLTSHYQRAKEWQSIKAMRPYVENLERTNDVLLVRYDTELYFMQGVAELMLQQYSNAVERFKYVIDEYPGTDQQANSMFWCGFAYLCLDDHEKAFEQFERYTRDFADLDPEKSMLDEAYYQGGICLFGMDDLGAAKDRFTYVIDTFGTNSTVYPDSCNMRGDIYGAEGGQSLDLAVQDYKNAFKYATKASQATYATFKMCDIFKADEQFYGLDYIREAVNLYLAQWGDRGADHAKAYFWLGRTEIQQGNYLTAAERYMEGVVDYGSDLRQDGVDLMIPELVKICKVFLTDEQREGIKNRLRIAMESTDSEVLRLRLRATLAKFDGTELELGKQLLHELPTMEDASPPVLALICEASFAEEDYSRSEELLRIFKYNFEDSDYMRSAYKLRASGQVASGNLDGALETIIETQENYGTEANVYWAQLMKADVLLQQARLFQGSEPVPEVKLTAESEAQLQIWQGKLEGVNEKLEQEKPDAVTKARLLEDQKKLNERISKLERAAEGKGGPREIRDLLAQCKLEEAREENKNVMGVPEWRGKPYAQATYQLGEVEEAAGNLMDAHGYFQRAYFQYKGQGEWAAKGYLAAAAVLKKMSEDPSISAEEQATYAEARIDTLRAMLLDRYANTSAEADTAREWLGPAVVAEVEAIISSGIETNIIVSVESTDTEPKSTEPSDGAGNSASEGDA